MQRFKQFSRAFFKGLLALYLAQVFLVLLWQFRPIKAATKDGARYEVFRGFGLPWALLPLIGVSPVVNDEPVRLVKTDLSTEHRAREDFDVFDDVVKKYPAVWPDRLP